MARRALGAMIACAIVGACGRPSSRPVTFNKDVAPIVFANCASCHRPGGDGPFSLLTYADAAGHATEIGEETLHGHMPPWLPEPGDVPIAGVRRLTPAQIETIQQWVRGGAPEGTAADLPAPPSFSSEWQLGAPDVVLTMPRPYVLSPGREDVYRNVILHGNLPGDVFVRAVELRTNGGPIHHALIRLARTSVPRSRDGEGGQPGFSGMASTLLQDPEGQLLGWAPGRGAMVSPEGMPWRLERGTQVVLELHLIPSDQPVDIQPSVALYFSSTPPLRVPATPMIVSKMIDIPAGEANYVVTDQYQLPVATELIGLFPHAHYLGKEMLVTATPPGAKPITLLHIRQWSFHWQQDYRFVTPVPLPKHTVIDLRFTYDNSANNPENPSRPPVRVRLGPRSTDEMANLGLQLLTESPADTNVLFRSFVEREILGNIRYALTRLRETPDSVPDLTLLGNSYVRAGKYADAIPTLEAALALDPRNEVAESNLGGAYQGLGRLPQAVEHFQRAARLAPDNERAHLNLAGALQKSGRTADAIAEYRRAIAINEESVEANRKLADLLLSVGRVKDALPYLRREAELLPDSADAHGDLGAALAESGFKDEAERSLRRALEIDPKHAGALENLGMLLRGGGE